MEPVFTLQWPEFVVAERLRKLLPAKNGYSVLIPLSRQEKGIDLVLLRRNKSGQSFVITIQVKASRTYLPPAPKRETTIRYQYYREFILFKKIAYGGDYIMQKRGVYPDMNYSSIRNLKGLSLQKGHIPVLL
jgi:hypothetical protein